MSPANKDLNDSPIGVELVYSVYDLDCTAELLLQGKAWNSPHSSFDPTKVPKLRKARHPKQPCCRSVVHAQIECEPDIQNGKPDILNT